jgi:hypothetical protein
MSTNDKYLLDSNVFIEAKRRYYAFDLCPAFWKSLIQQHQAGRVFSIDRVKHELVRGGDDLANWIANTMPASCFVSTADTAVVASFEQMLTWVQAQPQFLSAAKGDFASVADGW